LELQQTRLIALERHIRRIDRRLILLRRASDKLSRWRLGVFFVGIAAILVGLAFSNALGALAFLFWVIVFGILIANHRRVDRAIQQFEIWRTIKSTHIARMTLDWAHIPDTVAVEIPDHPFMGDLDIAGKRSVLSLLDTSISQGGAQRLADWLLSGSAELTDIQERQALVAELTPLTMFRERLQLNGSVAAHRTEQKWDAEALLRWLQEGDGQPQASLQTVITLGSLSAINIPLFALATTGILPPVWIGTWIIYLLISAIHLRSQGGIFGFAMTIKSYLDRFALIARHIQTLKNTKRRKIRTLSEPYWRENVNPSAQIRRLQWIVSSASLQRNPMAWFALNAVIPWDIGFAYLLARSKGDLAERLPRWLDVWYELEALCSLATFAYLNPEFVFPTIEPGYIVSVRQIGHPLIATDERICNDFALDTLGEVVIVTGSNMSGKSTFLRTLGVNLILAYAGGVVSAQELRVGLFRPFTCIKVSDSVVDGFSYFYAEVRRLKALLTALQDDENERPLFFLIDEIFRGTNNQERLIGSRSYIRALVGGNGVGSISTHDLELIKLADEFSQISNYHFREEVIDGKMAFDYQLRTGPSPTTNALKIMKLEGLPVDTIDQTDDYEATGDNAYLRMPR
jgi:energy-coupling factor transporter ATP-binding protein EcfA2